MALVRTVRQFHSQFTSKAERLATKRKKLRYERRLKSLEPGYVDQVPIHRFGANCNANPVSRVYVWGLACYGALGNPNYVVPLNGKKPLETMHKPVRCNAVEMKDVVDVACGYGFTVFAIRRKSPKLGESSCHLMGTGLNSHGQLGYHRETGGRNGSPAEVIIAPLPVTLPLTDGDQPIIRVAAGRSHTLALTGNGQAFSLGNNAFGQCGRDVVEGEDYLRNRGLIHRVKIGAEGQVKVTDVTCGMDHSLFLTDTGQVYACGWGADGQTGLGHYDSQARPHLVQGDIQGEKVIKVATSADCVLALNDRGQVFGWGNSEYGQFRSVTEEQQLAHPTKLDIDKVVGNVIDIAAGGTMCMVLNEDHEVFVWGYGILGKGPELENTKVPSRIPATLFGSGGSSSINSTTVTKSVHCGVGTCAAINSRGDLFMWGKNRGRCLGLGDFRNQYFPLKVALSAQVTRVSLGVDHSCAMAKPWS